MMQPYVREPKLTLIVGIYNQPKKYHDQESPIGEVISSRHEGFREAQVGNAQAWYYHTDKTIVLWECFFNDRFRKDPLTTDKNMQKLWHSFEHWRRFGLPDYAQFDNDTRFQGPHQYPDTLGTIIRMCLSLRVVPVFAPPREQGLQNAIESFNGRWQAKVWARFHHEAIEALQAQSGKYVAAYRARSAARMDAAPKRRAFPGRWKFNPQAKLSGRIIYIRRTNDKGVVSMLGRQFEVDRPWVYRLVRSEVDIADKVIRFYALRRREPDHQPLLREVAYELPPRYIRD
jgi:hypothetical protein